MYLSDLFWRWPQTSLSIYVPDGYELVETEEHKKQRLQDSLKEKKASLSYLEKRMAELSLAIQEEEKQYLALDAPDA